MKNLLLISIIIFFGLTNISAQSVKYGSRIGINIANINGDETDELTTRTSLHAGVIAEIKISDYFAVQPELLYSAQGAKSDKSETLNGTTYHYKYIKLEYINVPIMLKFYIAEGFSIEAGPQVGFLLTADREFEAINNGETEKGSEDIKDQLKEFDFVLSFGGGYKLDSGVFIAARYNLGLSDINNIEGANNSKNQNEVIQISIGYFF